jgi:hypothetical protein
MSDELRDLVLPVGDVEPPLDLHTRIVQRERELRGSRREAWHPPRVLMIAVAAAGVGLLILALAFAAHVRSSAPGPANHGLQFTTTFAGSFRCAAGDTAPAIEIRRPSHQQVSVHNWAHVHSQHPVATVVLRNVSGRRCYDVSGFTFTIRDRVGKIVGSWDSNAWFPGYYQPGGYRTFSLPAVYHCDRPGPFTAVAVVGGRTVRRHHLSLSDITC